MDEQLDLLSWRPAAQVIAFPAHRLIGRARRLVALSAKLTPAAMDRAWNCAVGEIDAAMELAGVPLPERDRQIGAFRDLVLAEITRQQLADMPTADHGGDAA